jgi:hypothetical protein
MYHDTTIVLEHSFKNRKSIYYSLVNFVNHEILLKIKTGYIQTDEGGVNTQYKSNRKQKMGTYAVNIYGWLMCKLTVPQRTIESKTNNTYLCI